MKELFLKLWRKLSLLWSKEARDEGRFEKSSHLSLFSRALSLPNEVWFHIANVYNEEVTKSKQEHGLDILFEHRAKTIRVIVLIFTKYYFEIKQISSDPDDNYTPLLLKITRLALRCLSSESRYYYNIAAPGEVKNKYQCHIEVVFSRLFRDFVNGQHRDKKIIISQVCTINYKTSVND